jgi:hypothetical protein
VLRKLSQIIFLLEGLSEKSAITVNDDAVKALLPVAGALDHLLEHGATIIPGGSALYELGRDGVAVGPTPRLQVGPLIRNGKIVLNLSPGRDPHVERGA